MRHTQTLTSFPLVPTPLCTGRIPQENPRAAWLRRRQASPAAGPQATLTLAVKALGDNEGSGRYRQVGAGAQRPCS